MKPFATLTGKIAMGAILSLLAVTCRGADVLPETRTPDEAEEIDRPRLELD
ncbi:MAG TPA: hypothetical protein VEQ85_09505 [Lacipirellulaceae bacterium]|nr:hypothetical protein [Lacipirellulaceae bacterium]